MAHRRHVIRHVIRHVKTRTKYESQQHCMDSSGPGHLGLGLSSAILTSFEQLVISQGNGYIVGINQIYDVSIVEASVWSWLMQSEPKTQQTDQCCFDQKIGLGLWICLSGSSSALYGIRQGTRQHSLGPVGCHQQAVPASGCQRALGITGQVDAFALRSMPENCFHSIFESFPT